MNYYTFVPEKQVIDYDKRGLANYARPFTSLLDMSILNYHK